MRKTEARWVAAVWAVCLLGVGLLLIGCSS